MKKLSLLTAVFAIALFAGALFVPVASVGALDPLADACSNGASSEICNSSDEDANDLIGTLVNVLLFVVGALATVMLIVGGIMYTTSTGDSGRITKAKNTIMYSIVGLVIAFLAYAIINWVVKIFA